MMAERGQITDDTIYQVAASVGLDIGRLKRDMAAPEIAQQLQANLALADALNIHGTPAFIVGDQVVPGAVDIGALKTMVGRRAQALAAPRDSQPQRLQPSALGVGLAVGMRRLERRELHAALENPGDRRIGRHVEPVAFGIDDLGDKGDVGETGLVAVAEHAGAAIVGEQRFQGLKAGIDPVIVPDRRYRSGSRPRSCVR